MDWQLLGLIIPGGAFFLGALIFLRKLSKDNKEESGRHRTIYKKIEDTEKGIRDDVVEIKICELVQKQNGENFKRIDQSIKDGIAGIDKKVGSINTMIFNWIKKNGGG